ncbi:MAG: hypothetical protein P4L46_04075 [Fimbriimonas sp.]|nr:hypothetical protein [Fimbriimonas sp.]
MRDRQPLSTLLSYALVAFTIEFDNEFEHVMPHRTSQSLTAGANRDHPWLVSMAMWLNCMQFVGPNGVKVGELDRLALTKTNLNGMKRWRYVDIVQDPTDARVRRPLRDWVIVATPGGAAAQQNWRSLGREIENRWRDRFGVAKVNRLVEAAFGISSRLDPLPECIPILGYGMFCNLPTFRVAPPPMPENRSLPVVLARVLLAFALEFERHSDVSLAVCANLLRLIPDDGMPSNRVPRLAGVSKEAIAMALGFLQTRGHIVHEFSTPDISGKVIRLTESGKAAQIRYSDLIWQIEEDWRTPIGFAETADLRAALEEIVVSADTSSPLFLGLNPYADGWRAKLRSPIGLPHFPMVLHRGGFPDGA